MEPPFDAESAVGFGIIYQPNPTPGSYVLLCEHDVAPVLHTNAFDYWPYETRP